MANTDGRYIISQIEARLDILDDQDEALQEALEANARERRVIRAYLKLLENELKPFMDE